MTVKWHAVDRLEDVGGVSGPGVVAYMLELDNGVLMFWDTVVHGEETHTVEWLPCKERLLDIHGHDGRTVLIPLAPDRADRGRKLMRQVIGDVIFTLGDLAEAMGDV